MYPVMQKYGVSSPYGARPELIYGFHYGVDFPTPVGVSVPLVAEGGVVYFEGWISFYVGGVKYNEIICVVNRDDGFADVYDHLSATFVSKGQRVKRGDVIGLTGRTGYVTGPHLHYGKLAKHYAGGVLNNYGWVNPTAELHSWGDEEMTTEQFVSIIMDVIEDNPHYSESQKAAFLQHVNWLKAEGAKDHWNYNRWVKGIMANNGVLNSTLMRDHLAEDARRLEAATKTETVEVIKEVPVVDPVMEANANNWVQLTTILKNLGVMK